jgi:peptidoglycan/LPS O-acetylase OafA/YrhL
MEPRTKISSGQRWRASALDMAECTPKRRASKLAAATTPRLPSPPTATGLPRRLPYVAGMIVLSMACRAWFAAYRPESLYGLILPVCAEYLGWGALAALLLKQGRFPRIPNGVLLYGALLALAILIALPRPEGARGVELQFQPGLAQTARALVFTALVVGLWRDDRSLPARILRRAPLVYLGKISYGLYLFHLFTFEPYAALVRRYPDLAVVDRRIALLALTIAVASLSWFAFERPLNRLKDRVAHT